MATNKKITQLDELTPATWADDDVIAIVDISAQETKKIQLSTFRGAVTGVSSLNADTPLTVDSATGDVTISVAINGGGTINAVFDEDNMASNSPTALATQQSIKAYVDSQVGTVDTLAEILANGNTSGGTNIVVSAGDSITTDTIAETTAAAGVTIDGVLVKDGQVDGRDVSVDGTKLDTVETNADVTDAANVTAAGALMDSELTNIAAVKALNQGVATTDSPSFAGITATTADINGGTIDGTTIGGSSAAAGTFTTLSATGNTTLGDAAGDVTQNKGGFAAQGTGLPASGSGVEINFGLVAGEGTVQAFDRSGSAWEQLRLRGNQVAFDISGSEKMRIDSSGNVGIGSSAPLARFNVDSGGVVVSSDGDYFAGGAYYNAGWKNSVASQGGWVLRNTGGVLAIQTAPPNGAAGSALSMAERMRIDGSGNVGIGTTSPAVKLDVSGSIRNRPDNSSYMYVGRYSSGYGGSVLNTSGGSTFLGIQIEGSEKMRIDSSGNVGIGTSSPSVKLELNNGGAGSLVTFTDGVATNFNFSTSGTVGTFGTDAGSTSLALKTAGSERMRIDSSGNVGIGISSGLADLLTVSESPGATYQIRIDTNGGFTTGNYSGIEFTQSNASRKGEIRLDHTSAGAGNLVFGTSDGASNADRFHIQNTGVWVENAAGPALLNEAASSTNPTLVPNRSDTDTGIGRASANNLTAVTGGSERMRINSVGSVGIGNTAPSYLLDLYRSASTVARIRNSAATGGTPSATHGEFVIESTDANMGMQFLGSTTADQRILFSDTAGVTGRIVYNHASNYMALHTNGGERLRIDSSGNLLVGQTSDTSPGFNDTNTGGAWSSGGTSLHLSRDSNAVAWLNRNTTTGTIQSFRYNGSAVGSVSVTASATAFNTSSDYRLKENVVAIDGAIDRVKLLKPSRFNFIVDPDTTVDGFVAHEVSDIVPEAVHGEKDAVDADGNPEYQGIDQSKLVPVLTAALQEALTKIEALEARIVALETA